MTESGFRFSRLASRWSTVFSNHRGKLLDVCAVAGSRVVRQGVLLIAMAVAARILSKELLGVWALINILIQFGVMLSDAGISTFLIREKEMNESLRSTAFYASVLLSLLVTSAMFAITVPLASYMGYADYNVYFMAASAAIIPMGINSILQACLRRERRFGAILAIDALANGLLLIGMIWMLLADAELWSFVIPTILASTIGSIVCGVATGIPAFGLDRANLRRVTDYSLGLVGFSTVNFWARNADQVLIGRFLGATPLGIYAVAYRIMMLPLSQVASIATTVALPYLAPHQDNHARLKLLMRKMLVVIGGITTAPIIFVWLWRYEFVDLFLGPGWERVGDLLTVLMPLSLFQVFVNPLGLCFQISGRTRLFFLLGVVNTIVTLTSFAVGVWLGTIDHVVNAYAIAFLCISPLSIHYGLKSIGGNAFDWFAWCFPFFLCLPVCACLHRIIGAGIFTDAALSVSVTATATWGAVLYAWDVRGVLQPDI